MAPGMSQDTPPAPEWEGGTLQDTTPCVQMAPGMSQDIPAGAERQPGALGDFRDRGGRGA